MIAARAGQARAALAEARAAAARVVDTIVEAEVHLHEGSFDPRSAKLALEMLRVARAAADASLREAQEKADLALDEVDVVKEREPETERRSSFQVPPAPVPSRPLQRVRSTDPLRGPSASAVASEQQRKPTS